MNFEKSSQQIITYDIDCKVKSKIVLEKIFLCLHKIYFPIYIELYIYVKNSKKTFYFQSKRWIVYVNAKMVKMVSFLLFFYIMSRWKNHWQKNSTTIIILVITPHLLYSICIWMFRNFGTFSNFQIWKIWILQFFNAFKFY